MNLVKDVKFAARWSKRDFSLYLLCYDAQRSRRKDGTVKRKPPFMLLLVIALLAILPLLAILQYHWLGQVSEGERERMKNNLNASAKRFSQDFDDEITAVFLFFQPSGALFGNQSGDNFAE